MEYYLTIELTNGNNIRAKLSTSQNDAIREQKLLEIFDRIERAKAEKGFLLFSKAEGYVLIDAYGQQFNHEIVINPDQIIDIYVSAFNDNVRSLHSKKVKQ